LYWIWMVYYHPTIIKDFFVFGLYFRKFGLFEGVKLF